MENQSLKTPGYFSNRTILLYLSVDMVLVKKLQPQTKTIIFPYCKVENHVHKYKRKFPAIIGKCGYRNFNRDFAEDSF